MLSNDAPWSLYDGYLIMGNCLGYIGCLGLVTTFIVGAFLLNTWLGCITLFTMMVLLAAGRAT